MITYTVKNKAVSEAKINKRLSSVAHLKDYRLEQLGSASYRIMVLPEQRSQCLRGAVLDALVDIYGVKGKFEIDIITEDAELLPAVKSSEERIKNVTYME